MTLTKYLTLFGLISILIGCRSTHRTVDKIKTSSQEITRGDLRDFLTTEGISTVQTIDRSKSVSVEAFNDSTEVTIEQVGNKTIIRGAKKIQLLGEDKTIREKNQVKTTREIQERTEIKKEEKEDGVQREVKKTGVPIIVWIVIGVLGLVFGVVFFVIKKGSIFGINFNFKSK